MKLQPLGNRLVIKPVVEKKKVGKIIIPETSEDEKSEQGKIIAIGKGERVAQLGLKIGNMVLFKEYGPSEIEIKDQKYLVADHDDVLAIIK